MSKPPAAGPQGNAGLNPNDKTDTKPKSGADEKDAMEEAQENAAEERATEGGYQ